MSRLYIRLAEIVRVGGKEQARGYNARMIVPVPGTPEAKKGTLIMLLDLAGPLRHHSRYLRLLLNTIQSTYYTTPGTVQSTLEYAIQEAHRTLLDINASIEREEDRYLCNVSCLVLQDDQLYLTQAGAMTAAIRRPDKPKLDWFSPLLIAEDTPYPLGMERDIRSFTGRFPAIPDTVILLLDSGWLNQIEGNRLQKALEMRDLQAMLRELAKDVESPNLSALALRVEEREEELGETQAPPKPEPLTQKLAGHVRAVTERLLPEEEEKRPPVEEEDFLEDAVAFGKPEPPPIPTPRPWPFKTRTPTVPALPWKRILWGVVIIIPLLALLITAGHWWRHSRELERQYRTAIEQAGTALQKATNTEDQELARQYLRQAEVAIRQAEEIHPDTGEIQRLKESLRNSRLRVERIMPFYLMWPLVHLPAGDWSRIIAHGKDIFVLDRQGDRVVRYTLDETGEHVAENGEQQILARGQSIGDRSVGDLVDITWLPAGQAVRISGVLVLDGAGALYSYDGRQGTRPLPFTRPDTWQAPLRITTYGDRLYVLDPGANAIFRFPATGEGFTAPPDNYFHTAIDLDGVVDFSIDGYVYLIFPDGRLLRYFRGEQTPFLVDTMLSSPSALYTTEALTHIYVADAGNKRIAVLGKEGADEGKLIAQLIPGEDFDVSFEDIRSLFVTEDEETIYILTGSGVWKAPLPVTPETSSQRPGGQ